MLESWLLKNIKMKNIKLDKGSAASKFRIITLNSLDGFCLSEVSEDLAQYMLNGNVLGYWSRDTLIIDELHFSKYKHNGFKPLAAKVEASEPQPKPKAKSNIVEKIVDAMPEPKVENMYKSVQQLPKRTEIKEDNVEFAVEPYKQNIKKKNK